MKLEALQTEAETLSLMEQAEEMSSAVGVFVLESNNMSSGYKKVANF